MIFRIFVDTGCKGQGTRDRGQGTRYRGQGTRDKVQGTRCRGQGAGDKVQGALKTNSTLKTQNSTLRKWKETY
ncbi:MAG: hypothetical protein IMY74_08150 [Bacteroidetes bacterium]|nr:hypothetical protein [Bacteroidota bacterium]